MNCLISPCTAVSPSPSPRPTAPIVSFARSGRSVARCGSWRRRLRLIAEAAVESAAVTVESDSISSVARRLILLRHAESSWDNPILRDHDRPLSKGGEEEAVKVSMKLEQLGWIPQLILCSDALRTRETLRIMQENIDSFWGAEVQYVPSFYSVAALDGQTAEHLQQTICQYSTDDIVTVMCMGHNRGWEEAASVFTGALVELKTCNAALLEAAGRSWEEAFTLAGLGGWKFLGVVKPQE